MSHLGSPLGTASGGAATSAVNTVTPTVHRTPKRVVVRIVREVSATLEKVTPPSRKECNHLVDARTGMAEEIPRTLLLRPTCQRSTCLSLLLSCVPFVAATSHPNTVLCLMTISAIGIGG